MLTRFLSLGLIIFPLASSAQDDRGCRTEHSFIVSHGFQATGQDSVQLAFYGYYADDMYLDSSETLIIELSDESVVTLAWEFYDENLWYYMNENVEWFFNGTEIDTANYSSYFEIGPGACGSTLNAGSTIKTRTPGIYQLKAVGPYNTNLPSILIREKAEPSMGVENVSLIIPELYPNPTNGLINISHGTIKDGFIYVFNPQGEIIRQTTLDTNSKLTTISLEDLSNGTYIIKAFGGGSQLMTDRVIKL